MSAWMGCSKEGTHPFRFSQGRCVLAEHFHLRRDCAVMLEASNANKNARQLAGALSGLRASLPNRAGTPRQGASADITSHTGAGAQQGTRKGVEAGGVRSRGTSTRTYNELLQRLARDGDMQGCSTVLEEMDAAKAKWDVFTFNAVLNCQSKARTIPSSEPLRLLAKMKEDNVAPNVITLNTALKFYARSVSLEAALRLVADMQSRGVAADAITYNSLLNICCKAGLMSRAEKVLEEMRARSIQPTPSTVTTLIMGYGSSGKVADAERAALMLPREPAVLRAVATLLVALN